MSIQLSCLSHVKRTRCAPASQKNNRPVAPSLYTDCVWCGDRSGSMSSMGLSPQEGGESFMKDHRNLANEINPERGYFLEYTTFDDKSETFYDDDARKITDRDLTIARSAMVPRGCTKFYDTAIGCVSRQQKRVDAILNSLPRKLQDLIYEKSHLVTAIFATFTDGMDNASIGDSSALSRSIQRHKEDYGATCLFLAANIDANTTGANCGFDEGLCMQMGSDRVSSAEALKICSGAMLRAATQQAPEFTRVERQRSNQTAPSAPSAQPNLSPQVNYAPGLVFGSRRTYYNSLRTPAVQPVPRLVRQNKVYFNLRSPAV